MRACTNRRDRRIGRAVSRVAREWMAGAAGRGTRVGCLHEVVKDRRTGPEWTRATRRRLARALGDLLHYPKTIDAMGQKAAPATGRKELLSLASAETRSKGTGQAEDSGCQ